ncbi:MAG TPA: hypothetical protein VM802_04215 [Chitinophaga sp.]|uniref:hypothetical protein n=1 Tax=Chitinophaga sp. TaxID=1869181 RepID=UPI002BEA00C5|nr:hypothetical protein [Chitinophaga sp.]HVI44042.1 hypothetical protein [Chitinophaga sp.]
MKVIRYFLWITFLAGIASCKKDKADFIYTEQPTQPPLTASNVRYLNYGRKLVELAINGKLLTSAIPPDRDGYYGDANTKPTLYFPSGRMGSSFTIPQNMILQDGTAFIQLGSMAYGTTAPYFEKSFSIKEDPVNPKDYYNVTYGPHMGQLLIDDSIFQVPRSVSPPADPSHFKVRLLNLGSAPDRAGLEGAFSLAWADGTLVDNKTNNVASGAYSDYIELPYGSYQFKVMTADGRQLPAVSPKDDIFNTVNPKTGTFYARTGNTNDYWLVYAPLQTYLPGGVYTIVVSANGYIWYPPGSIYPEGAVLNSYRVVADISNPVNVTYARIQAVNALPGSAINLLVDGKPIQEGSLGYSTASEFRSYITGTHTLEAIDAKGAVLAKQSMNLAGNDNFTAWVYSDATGKPALALAANNLSGGLYAGTSGDDGTYSHYKYPLTLSVRFLNLTTDLPEVTFTGDNGQLFSATFGTSSAASQHLKQGQVVAEQPYVIFPPALGISKIYAYGSQTGVLPGDWLRGIPALSGTDFIARKELYTSTPLPPFEYGVYTVALVGAVNPDAPVSRKAKMIIIKHNK